MSVSYSFRLVIPVLIALFSTAMVGVVYQNRLAALQLEAEREAISEVRRSMIVTQGAMEALLRSNQAEGVARVIASHLDAPYLLAMFLFQGDGRILFSARLADRNRLWRERGYSLSEALIEQLQTTRSIELVRSADGRSLSAYAPVCAMESPAVLRPQRCFTLFYQISLSHFRDVVGRNQWRQFLQEAGGIVVVSLLLWVIFHFILTRPTHHLIATLRAFSRGQRSARTGMSGGSELGRIGVGIDRMLERIVADEAMLREREEYLRLLFESVSEAVLTVDSDAVLLKVNRAAETMFGYGAEEMEGQGIALLFPAADIRRVLAGLAGGAGPNQACQCRARCKDGRTILVEGYFSLIDVAAAPLMVGVVRDVTARRQEERELEQLAYFDPLTALPNRALFKDRLLREIEVSRRNRHRFALLFIDLDRFKIVNDTLGHHVGDQLLQLVADRIRRCVRESDTVARLGGDEFTLILSNVRTRASVSMVAANIINSLQAAFEIEGHAVHIGASVGVAIYPDDGADCAALLERADAAMYRAKGEGRGCCRFFDAGADGGDLH